MVLCTSMFAGPLQASAPAGRYTISAGTVYDTKTRLTWQQGFSASTMAWADAKTYCAGIGSTLAGTGWRLPTVKELGTLVDNSLVNGPLIDLTAFPNTPSTWFWSSTEQAGTTNIAWLVAFANGSSNISYKTSNIEVRCVRGGT
jgi:hypothetical protein